MNFCVPIYIGPRASFISLHPHLPLLLFPLISPTLDYRHKNHFNKAWTVSVKSCEFNLTSFPSAIKPFFTRACEGSASSSLVRKLFQIHNSTDWDRDFLEGMIAAAASHWCPYGGGTLYHDIHCKSCCWLFTCCSRSRSSANIGFTHIAC